MTLSSLTVVLGVALAIALSGCQSSGVQTNFEASLPIDGKLVFH